MPGGDDAGVQGGVPGGAEAGAEGQLQEELQEHRAEGALRQRGHPVAEGRVHDVRATGLQVSVRPAEQSTITKIDQVAQSKCLSPFFATRSSIGCRFVPREKMVQKCDEKIREECKTVTKEECDSVCVEDCTDQGRRRRRTSTQIPSQRSPFSQRIGRNFAIEMMEFD